MTCEGLDMDAPFIFAAAFGGGAVDDQFALARRQRARLVEQRSAGKFGPGAFVGRQRREQDQRIGTAHQPLHLRLECGGIRSEEHTSELQSLMRISYAVFCLKKKKNTILLTQHKPLQQISRTRQRKETQTYTPDTHL